MSIVRAAACAAMVCVLAGCEPAPNSAPAVAERSNDTEPAPPPTAPEVPTLTLAKFNKLSDGMSYEAAVKIIGFEGTVQSSSALGGIKTVMYAWSDASGMQNMNAMFQNGKMITKAQAGLR